MVQRHLKNNDSTHNNIIIHNIIISLSFGDDRVEQLVVELETDRTEDHVNYLQLGLAEDHKSYDHPRKTIIYFTQPSKR